MRLTLAFLAGLFLGLAWQNLDALVGCTTDAECALKCPADDLDCDGGPQI